MKIDQSPKSLFAVWAVVFIALPLAATAAASDSATYQYYPSGRLQSITYANGTVITYTYDAAGNRTRVIATCSGNRSPDT